MDIFTYVFSALFIVEGLYTIITGRSFGDNEEKINKKYNISMYRAFNRSCGVLFLLGGIAFALMALADKGIIKLTVPVWIRFVVIGAVIVIIFVLALVLLRKKGRLKDDSSSEEYVDKD